MMAVGQDFILFNTSDVNASYHLAHTTNANLERETIELMDWSARTLELNPIEHACGMRHASA